MSEPYRMPQPGEGWRHYKGGHASLYTILDVGLHTESGEPVVVYHEFEPMNDRPTLFVRPLNVFLGSLEHEGRKVRRFAYERPAPTV